MNGLPLHPAHLWVDADACPSVVRDILFRAAKRVNARLTLVANQPIATPPSALIDSIQVAAGFDVADDEIVRLIQPNDLVITADIPLAAEAIDKGASALSPRGEAYTLENVRARLQMRDFMETLRGSGIHTGGPAALGAADKKRFADHLDRFLANAASP